MLTPPTPPEEVLHQYSCDISALRYDWRSITYTDGSCQKIPLPEGGTMNSIGAGVYMPEHRPRMTHTSDHPPDSLPSPCPPSMQRARQITIHAAGQCSTNTINRAELSAIWGAADLLHGSDPRDPDGVTHTIAPDSITSMYQIRRALHSPMDLHRHTHKASLDTIIAAMRSLLDRDPTHRITLLKVKAHSGDIGNEVSDISAKWAANHHD